MGKNITQKILEQHLVEGSLEVGKEIAIRIDHTLTQDATGTTAYLEFEAMQVSKVKTELSVSFVDHNTLQNDFRNKDDHKFLQTIAAKHGIFYSKPGNGICHQVFLERFAKPGKTLLGSDSHTPTAGGIGQLAIGAGGLDVAVAMAGGAFFLTAPKVVLVKLSGKLPAYVSAKDVILKLLGIVDVKGGRGKIFEYGGDGVKTLSIPDRATITNMGTETGCTTSIFPSDEITKEFMRAQKREDQWTELIPDADASYDEVIEINLSELEPLIAHYPSPGDVRKISEMKGTKINQVMIGSCTNSSLRDMKAAASIIKGKKVHDDVDLIVAPGSKQVLSMIASDGTLKILIDSGARILESACGPCIGMGQAPNSGGISLRTINRNFTGRSGTKDAQVHLVSPEVAAYSAIKGEIASPQELGSSFEINLPDTYEVDDSMIIPPSDKPESVEIYRGPNIVKLPQFPAIADQFKAQVYIKVGDDITTDHILKGGSQVLPLRSNLPEISKFTYIVVDPNFYDRVSKNENRGIIIGGDNYGQGSSREHAALAPRYLKVDAVLVKSFARIHLANLINFGILPLTFVNPADYDRIEQDDFVEIPNLQQQLGQGKILKAKNINKNYEFEVQHDLTERQLKIVKVGGVLNSMK